MQKGGSRKSFGTDVVTLVGGTTLAQIISIITSPIITRLYGADAFGLSALFTSLVTSIAVIACLRYELCIMLPKTDEEAANLLAISLLIAFFISLILVPIVWLFGDDLSSLLNAPGLQKYLFLVPPMVFLSGSFSAINYWNSRKRQFARLSKTQVTKATIKSGIQLGSGFTGYASGGTLIGAVVVSQAVATSALGYQAWKSDNKLLCASINHGRMVAALNKYKDFPKIDVWSALINTFSLQMPVFILSAFFTTTIVGYYSLGLMVLQLPMSFIGSAIAQVFFQRAAEAKNVSRLVLTSVVEKTVDRLIVLGFFPLLLLSLIGKDVFTVIFGTAWAEAGVYAQILSFTILVSFITSPMTTLFTVQKKLRAFFLFNVAMMASRVIPLVWGG